MQYGRLEHAFAGLYVDTVVDTPSPAEFMILASPDVWVRFQAFAAAQLMELYGWSSSRRARGRSRVLFSEQRV